MKLELKSPFIITPRLMCGVKINDGYISIGYDRYTPDGRMRYRYYIDLPNEVTYTSNDLKSGVGGGTLRQGMESLLCFLGSAAESYSNRIRKGETIPDEDELGFNENVLAWASFNLEEINMLQIEIEESKESLIIET